LDREGVEQPAKPVSGQVDEVDFQLGKVLQDFRPSR
jgi:hypothetical protein